MQIHRNNSIWYNHHGNNDVTKLGKKESEGSPMGMFEHQKMSLILTGSSQYFFRFKPAS